MEKSAKNALTITGIVVGVTAAAAATAYFTTKYLVNTALDRKAPKLVQNMDRFIAGSDISSDFLNELDKASEKLESSEHETVQITSSYDGIALVGHYFPVKKAKRVIVAVHGWRSSWHRDFGLVSDFWKENGCSVLYVEQRGQNNSGGDYMGFGLTERFDCLDWARWADANTDAYLPIYLAGISMGATTVMMASALDLPQRVHGIMADCGFTSPSAIFKHVAHKNLHISYGIRGGLIEALCKQKINLGPNEYSSTEALRETNIPVLFIHGTNDTFVPVEMTYENYSACASPKRLLVVPGADHGMSYFVEPEKYKETIKEFWASFDKIMPAVKTS